MKRFLSIIWLLLVTAHVGFCEDFDYQKIYREMDMPNFSYIHNIDPDQYFECQGFTWSPYPLLRLNSPLFFKNITIDPGYYNLTPREHDGRWFILFKEAGLIKYIIPVYKKDFVSEFFYEENLPKAKLSISQKVQINTLDFIGKYFPAAKRKPIPQTYLETTDLDGNFVSIVVYYKEFKYYTILRTIKM